MANITVAVSESNVTVTETPLAITVNDSTNTVTVTPANTQVSVASTTSNVTVGEAFYSGTSNATIRAAIGNTSPILYNATTGVIGFDSNASFAGKTTDDLAEGSTNLYYTDARVQTKVANLTGNVTTTANVSGAFILGDGSLLTGVDNNADVKAYIESTGLSATADLTTTANVSGAYILGNGSQLTGVTSLTNAQVVAHIATVPLTVGGNLIAGINATSLSTFTGNAFISGSLTVGGNIDYVQAQDLLVKDQSISINVGNVAQDAMIIVDRVGSGAGSNTELRWNETTDKWTFTNDGSTYYNIATSTTDLAEGTNLYYTDASSRAALSVATGTPSGNGALTYNSSVGEFTFTPADLSNSGISNAQAQAYIQTNGLAMTNAISSNSNISTTDNARGIITNRITPTADGENMVIGIDSSNLNRTKDLTVYQTGNVIFQTNDEGTVTDKLSIERDGNVIVDIRTRVTHNENSYFLLKGDDPSGGSTNKEIFKAHNDKNITAYGPFTTSSNITASGNITGSYILGNGSLLTGITSGVSSVNTQTGVVVLDTDDIAEGTNNKYFTTTGAAINTTALAEGTNLYYTDARSRAAVSVTTATPTGNGSLTYNNTSGVFTFTPAVPGASNYGDANVISLLGAYTDPISTTANLSLNIATAVDNLYGVRFDSATNKFISSPTASAQAPTHFLTVEKEGTDLEFIRSTVARAGAFGTKELYEKANGTLASPTFISDYNETWQQEHAGWDGAKYEDSLGIHVFQDARTASASADTVPLAYEVYGKLGGDTTQYDTNFMSIHADGKIVFNDPNGARGFNQKIGTANISRDGSFVSNANITAVGNISGAYILGDGSLLTGLPATYGNANVITLLGDYSNTITTTANINTLGNLNLGNTTSVIFGTNTNAGQLILDDGGKLEFVTESDLNTAQYSAYRDGSNGTNFDFFKAGGSIASPTAIGPNDYVYREEFFAHDGTQFYSNYGAAYAVYQDSDAGSVGTDDIPLTHEFSVNRTPSGFPSSVMKMTADRQIIFNDTGVKNFGDYKGTANLSAAGAFHTAGNITSDGNIAGNYFVGNGSLLTGITGTTDSFGTILVAGETNIQATQANAQLTLASSGDITLTTAGNTVTIGGSGGTYGNSEVEAFLGSDTMTGDIVYKGNMQLSTANVSTSIAQYQGNDTTGTGDRVLLNSDVGWFNGQYVTFSGTTNTNLTFLNGNTYQVAGGGTTWNLYTDYKTFTKLSTATGTESPTNGLVADHRTASNTTLRSYGNVYVENGATLHADTFLPATTGAVIEFNAVRIKDLGIQDGGGNNNFFFPQTGGNSEGYILTAHTDNVGTWEPGLRTISESAVEVIESKIYRDGGNGSAMDFYKAGGSIASPTAPGSNDMIMQMDQFCHDGTAFQNAAGYHVYQDGDSGSVGTNVTPVSHEFYVKKDSTGFQQSVMKLTADRKIIFNDTGTRSFGDYKGTANIAADGSFHTAGDITIDGRLKLPNYTTTEINALGTPVAGDTVFNTTESTICFYTGSAWNKVTSTAL